MSSPAEGAARLVRGAFLSVLTVALAAVAHVLGGGHVPTTGLLAGSAVLLLPVGVLAAGRQVRAPAAGVLLAAGQGVLHLAYSFLMGCTAVAAAPASGAPAGHAQHAAAAYCAATATPGRPVLGGVSMLVLHAVATVLTAIAVGAAERLVWWVRRQVAARLAPSRPAPVPRRPRPLLVGRLGALPVALHLRARPTRRGPPRTSLLLGVQPS